MESETWTIDENQNVNECCSTFHDKLSGLIEEHLPVITRNVTPHKYRWELWLSEGIMRCINKCKKYYKITLLKNATNSNIIR